MAGRPKSNQARKAAGNPSRRPFVEPPIGQMGIPTAPSWLDEIGLKYWHFYTRQLDGRPGGFQTAWGPAVASLCSCAAGEERCMMRIQIDGDVVPGERGFVKHPASQLARDYRSHKIKYEEMFGLGSGPQYRQNLPDVGPDDDEDFAPPNAFTN